MDLLPQRLFNQRLTGKKFIAPEDAVRYFGAVQSQDFAAAKWSVGLRVANATNETVEHAYNQGKILRTHVLRPTWHFISPEDIHMLLTLSAPQIKKLSAYYNRQLGLTDEVFQKTNAILANALKGHTYLTRQELKTILEKEGIPSSVQRLGHIMQRAEIDRIITSGPLRGKQFTYALFEERVPKTKGVEKEKALGKLAETYFTSHGPSFFKDFAWWSGLSIKDATNGLHMISSKLEKETVADKTYWFSPQHHVSQKEENKVFLLSVYDEYFISYTDRTEIYDKKHKEKLPIGNALLTSLLIIHGKVAGTWKRTIQKNMIIFTLFPFDKLAMKESYEIEKIIHKYGNFFGLPTEWKH